MIWRLQMAIRYIVSIAQTALVIRAVLSWFQTSGFAYSLYSMIYALTEPIVEPVRKLLNRLFPQSGYARVDFSLFATMILLELFRILFL